MNSSEFSIIVMVFLTFITGPICCKEIPYFFVDGDPFSEVQVQHSLLQKQGLYDYVFLQDIKAPHQQGESKLGDKNKIGNNRFRPGFSPLFGLPNQPKLKATPEAMLRLKNAPNLGSNPESKTSKTGDLRINLTTSISTASDDQPRQPLTVNFNALPISPSEDFGTIEQIIAQPLTQKSTIEESNAEEVVNPVELPPISLNFTEVKTGPTNAQLVTQTGNDNKGAKLDTVSATVEVMKNAKNTNIENIDIIKNVENSKESSQIGSKENAQDAETTEITEQAENFDIIETIKINENLQNAENNTIIENFINNESIKNMTNVVNITNIENEVNVNIKNIEDNKNVEDNKSPEVDRQNKFAVVRLGRKRLNLDNISKTLDSKLQMDAEAENQLHQEQQQQQQKQKQQQLRLQQQQQKQLQHQQEQQQQLQQNPAKEVNPIQNRIIERKFEPIFPRNDGQASKGSCDGLDHGYYPNSGSGDCAQYFVCLPLMSNRLDPEGKQLKRGARRWDFKCGPGTIFSPKHLACVHNDGSCEVQK